MSKYHEPKITHPTFEAGKKWKGGRNEPRLKNTPKKVTAQEEADFCLNCKKPVCAYGCCAELKEFLGGKRIE